MDALEGGGGRNVLAVPDFRRIPGELTPAIVRIFAERGIEIPFPVVRQIRTVEAREPRDADGQDRQERALPPGAR